MGAASAGQPADVAELLELYRRRDYFELRERLGGVPEGPPAGPVELRFVAGAVQHAFNRPLASNRTLGGLHEAGEVPPALAGEALRLRMANHLRRHEYAFALAAARELLAAPASYRAPGVEGEVRNTARLLAALAEVPPQTVAVDKTTRLSLRLDGRVPLDVGDRTVRLGVDTGANFSVLARSEAERLELEIRPLGLRVSTSIGVPAEADVAVAARARLGGADYRHVVFLVFPDELLKFPDGRRIPGLVGFPMLEALGEVRFWSDNTMEIPARPPRRKGFNLAFDDQEPLVRAQALGGDLVCRLDTGSNRTFFYSPFYRRFEDRIDTIGDPQRVKVGGVGGVREIRVYRLPFLTLSLARADIRITRADVYTQALVDGAAEYLDCNVGRDALRGFRFYGINFRSTTLVLG